MSPEEIRCKALEYSLECRMAPDKASEIISRAAEFEAYLEGGRAAGERKTLTLQGPTKASGNKPPSKG